ncbi:permease-like cell division protein FtsX [Nonomuraea pusilla]|uniref:permease-like cell division protein FtsX n=1 Tax=Nonomuraea pusilla TaxID=46177 RepID=UPI003319F356
MFLCSKADDYRAKCGGRDVTGAQRQAVESYLRGRAEVTQVRFVSREESYRRFRQEYAGQERILSRYTAEDLPESYRVRVKPDADRGRLLEEVRGLKGVGLSGDLATLSSASRQRAREELSAFLCMPTSPSGCGKKPRAATPAQIEAVNAAIKKMPGIVSVHFENRQEAFENFRSTYAENRTLIDATRVEDMPESFRMTLREGADRSKVAEALERLPGVSTVIDQQCLNDASVLTAEYGVREPKVC